MQTTIRVHRELLGWARWTRMVGVALVRTEVPVAAHRGVLPMLQWVPTTAVTPAGQHLIA